MVKHIVMWKVQGTEEITKGSVLARLKQELEELNGQIEGLIHLEVGINENTSASAYDAVLYSTFKDEKALEYYQQHEKHQYVANQFVRPFTIDRAVVDFEDK